MDRKEIRIIHLKAQLKRALARLEVLEGRRGFKLKLAQQRKAKQAGAALIAAHNRREQAQAEAIRQAQRNINALAEELGPIRQEPGLAPPPGVRQRARDIEAAVQRAVAAEAAQREGQEGPRQVPPQFFNALPQFEWANPLAAPEAPAFRNPLVVEREFRALQEAIAREQARRQLADQGLIVNPNDRREL